MHIHKHSHAHIHTHLCACMQVLENPYFSFTYKERISTKSEHLQYHPEHGLIKGETMRFSIRLNLICSNGIHWSKKNDKIPSKKRIPGLITGFFSRQL